MTYAPLRSKQEISRGPLYEFPRFKHIRRLLLFVSSPLNMVDVAAFLPFYIDLVVNGASARLSVLRLIRLVRILLIPELGNLHQKLEILGNMIRRLAIYFVVFLIFSSFVIVIGASILFYTDGGSWDSTTGRYLRRDVYLYGPKVPSVFVSIPDSFWW